MCVVAVKASAYVCLCVCVSVCVYVCAGETIHYSNKNSTNTVSVLLTVAPKKIAFVLKQKPSFFFQWNFYNEWNSSISLEYLFFFFVSFQICSLSKWAVVFNLSTAKENPLARMKETISR